MPKLNTHIEHSVCIVTGASSAFGRAVIADSIERGLLTIAVDDIPAKQPTGFRVVDKQYADASFKPAVAYEVDLTALTSVQLLVEDITKRFGAPNILINHPTAYAATPLTNSGEEADDAEWESLLESFNFVTERNILSTLLLSRKCIPLMQSGGGGEIINMTSLDVLPTQQGMTNPIESDAFNAAKWAINGFTDAWSKYLANDNIRVNGLCVPRELLARGILDTGTSNPQGELNRSAAARLWEIIQIGRSGENVRLGSKSLNDWQPAAHRKISG